MSDVFYVYEDLGYKSLYVFKDKQPKYMFSTHKEHKCLSIGNDIDSYIYFLQHKYDSGLNDLKQQLAERDELIIELSDKVDFYGDRSNWVHDIILADEDCEGKGEIMKGGKLARTPLKNQKLLDEIKGRVK